MDTEKHAGKWAWATLFLITLIYFFANMQKVLVPGATFNELQHIMKSDAATVTRLGSIFLYVYAAGQLVTGLLADRFSGIRVILCGGVIFCVGSLLSAFTGSYVLLCASRFMTGLGAAAIYLSMVKEFARVTGNALPFWIGIATIIGYSGAITGASPFIAGVERFGYFKMMLATGMLSAAIFLGFCVCRTRITAPPINREVKFTWSSYWAVLRIRHNICNFVAVGINFGTYFAIQSIIGKKFLEDFCSFSNHAAGAVMTVTMLIAAVNGFVLANLSRLWGNRRRPFLLFSSFGCLAGALMIFGAVYCNIRAPFLTLAGVILMAFAGNVSPIYVALIRETNAEHRFGTALSVGNCFAYGVTAVFGGVLGKLMDFYAPVVRDGVSIYGRDSYLLVFSVLLGLAAISAILSLFLKESFGRDITATVR